MRVVGPVTRMGQMRITYKVHLEISKETTEEN
jgi:hypothetical protein